MSIQKEIKEFQLRIKSIEHDIKTLQRPEEKLRNAQEQYNKDLQERADLVISCHAEIAELSGKLSKPWTEYADSNIRGRFKIHDIANEIACLHKKISSLDWEVDLTYRNLQERKNMLDNFNGLMSNAEKRLREAKDNLEQYEKILQLQEGKKRPKKEKIPVSHIIRIDNVKDKDIYLNSSDIKDIALNGAKGMTITDGSYHISISKNMLKDIILDFLEYTVKVNDRGLSIQAQETAYYRFYWQRQGYKSHIYTDAYLDIDKKYPFWEGITNV